MTREESGAEEARIVVFVVLSFVENRTILTRERERERFVALYSRFG